METFLKKKNKSADSCDAPTKRDDSKTKPACFQHSHFVFVPKNVSQYRSWLLFDSLLYLKIKMITKHILKNYRILDSLNKKAHQF